MNQKLNIRQLAAAWGVATPTLSHDEMWAGIMKTLDRLNQVALVEFYTDKKEPTIQTILDRYTANNYGNDLGGQLVKAADMKALADGYKTVQAERDRRAKQLEERDADIGSLSGINAKLREDVANRNDRIKQLEDTVTAMRTAAMLQAATLIEDVDYWKGYTGAVKIERDKAKADLGRYERELVTVSNDYCRVVEAQGKQIRENQELTTRVKELEAKLHEALTALDAAEAKAKEFEGVRSLEISTIRTGKNGETECLSGDGEVDLWLNASRKLQPNVGDRIAVIPKPVEPVKLVDPWAGWNNPTPAAKAANSVGPSPLIKASRDFADAVAYSNMAIAQAMMIPASIGFGCKLPETKQPWEHARDQVLSVRPDAHIDRHNRPYVKATNLCGNSADNERGAWIKARDMLADCGVIAM